MQRLYRFLAFKNIDVAKRAVKTIRDGVQRIALQPNSGRPVDDMEPEYREWLIDFGESGYVALYRYDGTTAVILAVRHQKEVGF
jgi:plasmid stabilization system protein ParE